MDGLGLCKKCRHLKKTYSNFVKIDSFEYLDCYCPKIKGKSYSIRNSLVSCDFFKTKTKLWKRIIKKVLNIL